MGQLETQHQHHRGIEGEKKEQGTENLFEEIITEHFPNLLKEKDTQVQEAQNPKQGKHRGPHQDTS